uniref:Acyl-CoA dehydrogenase n=1 Tax=Panagrolaimus sp. JU765 TaxID=591449 RepID=A0AC34Q5W2_9BILA
MAKATAKMKSTRSVVNHLLYGPNHLAFANSITQYINTRINPFVDEWEKNKIFPAKVVFNELGKLGVFGVNKPIGWHLFGRCNIHLSGYGGLGLDFSYSVLVAETMGKINCGAIPMAIAVQSDMATPALSDYGSDYLKREFLLPSMLGERVSCLGVSEACAGSDVAAIKTTAHWHGDDLIINGSKQWITNGHQADWICLLANTNQNASNHRNKSLICVNMNEPGVKLGRQIEKLGMHSSDTAEIFFDQVRVPARNIIGDEGRGFVYQMAQFQDERLVAVAVLLEPLSRILAATMQYTQERRIFGEPVLSNQCVRYKIAELSAELEAVRSLLYRSVIEKLSGSDVTLLASMAKLKAARLARTITDDCLQFWGGNGYTWDNIVSRFYRDLRLFSIAGGADEVMLSIISKNIIDAQK